MQQQLISSSRRSRSRIHETPSYSTTKREQFEATRKWNELLHEFSKKIPRETHKRQMRTYMETFTGKEALECMTVILPTIFNNNKPYEPMVVAKNLLNNYLDLRYIVNVREEHNRQFSDNATLYRLDNERISQYLEDHAPPNKFRGQNNNVAIARTSSARESKSRIDEEPNFGMSKSRMNLNSPQWDGLQLKGRLSISCQDISITESKSRKITKPTKEEETKRFIKEKPPTTSERRNLSGFIMESISKASTSLFSLNRSASHSEEPRKPQSRLRSTNSNPKFLDEKVLRDGQSTSSKSILGSSATNHPSHLDPKASASVFRVRTNFLQQQEAVRGRGNNNNLSLKTDPRMLRIRTPYDGGKENSPSPNEPAVTAAPSYCQRVNRSTYEQQSKSIDQHMAALLEQILTNPSLTEAEKFEKLKQFRVNHPTIYAKRFPSQTDPLLNSEGKNNNSDAGSSFTADYIGNALIKQFRKIGF